MMAHHSMVRCIQWCAVYNGAPFHGALYTIQCSSGISGCSGAPRRRAPRRCCCRRTRCTSRPTSLARAASSQLRGGCAASRGGRSRWGPRPGDHGPWTESCPCNGRLAKQCVTVGHVVMTKQCFEYFQHTHFGAATLILALFSTALTEMGSARLEKTC